MAEADWDEVTYLRKKPVRSGDAKSQKMVNAAQRKGQEIDTTKKHAAATNKQKSASKDTAKLDRETEELRHEKVTMEFSKALQQARLAKGLTQKELATKINEKPQVVNEYEAGKAIPNQQIISKLERAVGMYKLNMTSSLILCTLGVRLRGKDIGTPFGKSK